MEDAVTDCTAGDSHFNLGQLVRHTHVIQDATHATRPPYTLGTKPGRSTQAASRFRSSCFRYHDHQRHNLKGTAGNSDGRMLYRLAEKRCKNFGTCRTNIAEVNKQILSLFISGKKSLEEGR